MFDVIRVNLLDGVKRFPMFTVRDHLNFLLTSADMEGKPPSEKQIILDEILDILYPGYSKTEQEFIFIKVYCASFGRNAIKTSIKSKKGTTEAFLHITDYQLCNEYKIDDSITLGFNFPKTREINEDTFLHCISYILHNGTRYEWTSLDDDTKNSILDLVEVSDIEKIVEMLIKSCHAVVRDMTISNLSILFNILFTKSEVNEFFKTNFLLNKNNIHVESIMNTSPMERLIYVALVAEELRKKNANS